MAHIRYITFVNFVTFAEDSAPQATDGDHLRVGAMELWKCRSEMWSIEELFMYAFLPSPGMALRQMSKALKRWRGPCSSWRKMEMSMRLGNIDNDVDS